MPYRRVVKVSDRVYDWLSLLAEELGAKTINRALELLASRMSPYELAAILEEGSVGHPGPGCKATPLEPGLLLVRCGDALSIWPLEALTENVRKLRLPVALSREILERLGLPQAGELKLVQGNPMQRPSSIKA